MRLQRSAPKQSRELTVSWSAVALRLVVQTGRNSDLRIGARTHPCTVTHNTCTCHRRLGQMASLMRQACSIRPVCRSETRTTQQTLFHLVASSSYNNSRRVLPRTESQRNVPKRRLESVAMATTFEAAKRQGPAGDEDSRQFAIAIARVVDEVKCSDIVVLDVAPVVSWTSFLVVATVSSKPQLLAALARVEKAAAEQFGRVRLNLPGSSPWETLDFGDVVLHLFTNEQREYYDIESFYAAAEEVELPFGPDGATPQESGKSAPTWSTKL